MDGVLINMEVLANVLEHVVEVLLDGVEVKVGNVVGDGVSQMRSLVVLDFEVLIGGKLLLIPSSIDARSTSFTVRDLQLLKIRSHSGMLLFNHSNLPLLINDIRSANKDVLVLLIANEVLGDTEQLVCKLFLNRSKHVVVDGFHVLDGSHKEVGVDVHFIIAIDETVSLNGKVVNELLAIALLLSDVHLVEDLLVDINASFNIGACFVRVLRERGIAGDDTLADGAVSFY